MLLQELVMEVTAMMDYSALEVGAQVPGVGRAQ